MTLLEECIEALGCTATVYDAQSSIVIIEKFRHIYQFTNWGRIDWEKINSIKKLRYVNQLEHEIKTKECFILWDEATLPVIKSTIQKFVKYSDDVLAVSFDTWILSTDYKCVVEFYHEGEHINQ